MSVRKCGVLVAGTAWLAMAVNAGAATLINEDFNSYTPGTGPAGAGLLHSGTYGGSSYQNAAIIADGGVGNSQSLNITLAFDNGPNSWQGYNLTMKADSPGAKGYGFASPGGATLADFQYSFIAQGGAYGSPDPFTPGGFFVIFRGYDASGTLLGSSDKVFSLAAASTLQSFSGNLGEGGWNPVGGGAALPPDAASYSFTLVLNADAGTPSWTRPSSINSVILDNVSLSVAVPEPATLSMAFMVVAGLGLRRRRR